MNTTLKAAAATVAAIWLFFGHAQAGAGEATEPDTATTPGVIDKAGNAVEHGAHVAVDAVERGAKAAARGIERGVKAAAGGVERGARATGKAADTVARKVGVSKTADADAETKSKAESGKP